MYPRHRLDFGVGDLLSGLAGCLRAGRGETSERELLRPCELVDRGLVTLSVRSARDLLLTALDWPPGDEVLMSPIAHPDMAAIADSHGLRVVPLDLDPDTLAPRGRVDQASVYLPVHPDLPEAALDEVLRVLAARVE